MALMVPATVQHALCDARGADRILSGRRRCALPAAHAARHGPSAEPDGDDLARRPGTPAGAGNALCRGATRARYQGGPDSTADRRPTSGRRCATPGGGMPRLSTPLRPESRSDFKITIILQCNTCWFEECTLPCSWVADVCQDGSHCRGSLGGLDIRSPPTQRISSACRRGSERKTDQLCNAYATSAAGTFTGRALSSTYSTRSSRLRHVV